MSEPVPLDTDDVEQWFQEEAEASPDTATLNRDPAEKYAASQLRVVRETKDYQLDYLKMALQPGPGGLIDTSPKYQRRDRWNSRKRSLLIESFLLNIPVPPIFLFEHDYNAYEVIDGRQRLEALRAFLSNEFALSGLEYWAELNGKRFNGLPEVIKKGLMRRSLPAVILLAETRVADEQDLDVRRVLFDRLNTGGVNLNPQELRNALYHGPLNTLLADLARTQVFTQAWGIPAYTLDEESDPPEALVKNALYSTFADAELVLRVFALRDAIQNDRKGSLRLILDRYMKANADIDEGRRVELTDLFTTSLGRLNDVFEDRPFLLGETNRRSRPLYDALMVALSLDPRLPIESNRLAIQSHLSQALADPARYDVLVGRGNTIQSVKDRVELAGKILGG